MLEIRFQKICDCDAVEQTTREIDPNTLKSLLAFRLRTSIKDYIMLSSVDWLNQMSIRAKDETEQ